MTSKFKPDCYICDDFTKPLDFFWVSAEDRTTPDIGMFICADCANKKKEESPDSIRAGRLS